MSALRHLVRIHSWQLDDKRQKLSDLQGLLDKLAEDLAEIDRQIAAESALAESEDLVLSQQFDAFLGAALERKKRLESSLEVMEREVEKARGEVSEAFQDLKRYEMARENQVEEERRQDALAESAELDEAGLASHRRGQDEAL